MTSSLNPFDIRACVQTFRSGKLTRDKAEDPSDRGASVHTTAPLAVTTQDTPSVLACVLIPLISGHVFKLTLFVGQYKGPRLNPFDIRACVQTCR